jgi:RNA ligase (TIGR02306 family)
MKLSGVLSQGICFPLSILPQDKEYEIEDDVTEIVNVIKYEANNENKEIENKEEKFKKFQHPIFKFLFKFSIFRKLLLPKKQNKGFPEFISKTDETRIQNMPFILKNKDIKFVVREKVDGQSGTFFLKKLNKKWFWKKQNYDFGVCSRNLRLWNEDNGSQWFVSKKYNLKNVLVELIGENDFVAIQGECVAPNVQGNKYKVSEPDLYAFNLIYPNGKVNCIEAEKILKKYNIKWCPLINSKFTLPDTVNEILDFATDKSKLYNTLREGVVLRNYNKNISFKAVSPEFLIKNDE